MNLALKNARLTGRLLTALEAAGFHPVRIDDGDGEWQAISNRADAIAKATAVDECTILFRGLNRTYAAALVYGNADHELVSDFADVKTEEGRAFTAAIEAWSEKEEK